MHQPQVDEDQFGERNEGKKDIWNCVNKCMDYFPSAKNLICTNNLSFFFLEKQAWIFDAALDREQKLFGGLKYY